MPVEGTRSRFEAAAGNGRTEIPIMARGATQFAADADLPARRLHVVLGLSGVASGRIVRVDLDPVRRADGVIAVLTASDIPGQNELGQGDQAIIAAGDVHFHGEVRFAVVATSADLARRAVALAKLSIAPAIAIGDLDDAIASDSRLAPDRELTRGDPAAEMPRGDRRLIGQLRIGGQDEPTLEGAFAVAVPTDGPTLVIRTTAPDPGLVQQVVAAALAVDHAAIVVESPRLGGTARSSVAAAQWATITALAARMTGWPCILDLTREEEALASGNRADVKVNYAAGFDQTGLLRAVDITLAMRCGHAADASHAALDRALLGTDNAYHFPAFRVVGRPLRTNTVPAVLMRGAGAEGAVAAERIMDHIACSLGIDPLDVRRVNLLGPGRDRTVSGMIADEAMPASITAELERTSSYRRRRLEAGDFNRSSPILKKGIALTPFKYGVGFGKGAQALAQLHLRRDGSLSFGLSMPEAGDGLSAKARALIAGEFGVPPDCVWRDPTISTAAFSPGRPSIDAVLLAVIAACREIKDALYDLIEDTLTIDRERVEFANGEVRLGDRSIPLEELVGMAAKAAVQLSALAMHRIPDVSWNGETGLGRPFHYWVFGAACAEVTLDVMTGEKRIDRVDILIDAGRSLSPPIDRTLVEGGFAMGLGWLTSEELPTAAVGHPVARGAGTYLIPTVADMPDDLRLAFHQSGGNAEETAYRSKDIFDASVLTALPVFSAMTDALMSLRPGTMPRLAAPATPEAVMRAIRSLSEGDR